MSQSQKPGPALAGLKRIRSAFKMSQLRLAELIGVSPKCISRYETEEILPRLSHMRAMCQVLNCQLWQLFFDPTEHRLAA